MLNTTKVPQNVACFSLHLMTLYQPLLLYVLVYLTTLFSGTAYRMEGVVYDERSLSGLKKVKCTLVQALRLCTGLTAHRGSRVIALLFLDHSTRRGWGVSVTPWPLFTHGEDPVPIVQGAGWAPGSVWTGAENLALTGIRSPDRPARRNRYTDWAVAAHLI